MSRRYHRNNENIESKHPARNSPFSLDTVNLQARRKKENQWWRSDQVTDPDSIHTNVFHTEDTRRPLSVIDRDSLLTRNKPLGIVTDSVRDLSNPTSTMVRKAPPISTTRNTKAGSAKPAQVGEASTVPNHDSDTRIPIAGQADELFGTLPDPIRLHEQTGEFDGQVIFIGHPNRDISAHQWDSAAFQWENIGRYSHSRARIEGSLASDRPKEYKGSFNSITYFKMAAEGREGLVVDHRRSADKTDDDHPPGSEDSEHDSSSPNHSNRRTDKDPSIVDSHTVSRENHKAPGSMAANIFSTSTGGGHYEDPFVIDEVHKPAQEAVHGHIGVDTLNKGSLDLHYTFPSKPMVSPMLKLKQSVTTTAPRMSHHHGTGMAVEPSHSARAFQQDNHNTLHDLNARNLALNEEALSPGYLSRADHHFSPMVPGNEFEEIQRIVAGHNRLPNIQQERVAVPRATEYQPTARALFPRSGLTIANPFNGDSEAYNTARPHVQASGAISIAGSPRPSSAISGRYPQSGLHFSDPDMHRQGQVYEIANGLSKQPPTVQNFKGPFFTENKPTAHDPTVSLSVQNNEEERLVSWFRDGHRPARQKDFAKTLIKAAVNSNKDQNYGAIGEAHHTSKGDQFKNTALFVRLHENLSEYVEEYRNGSGGSYFTRAWKPAPPQLRDLTPGGNSSYLASLVHSSPTAIRPGNRAVRSRLSPEDSDNSSPMLRSPSHPFHGAVGDKAYARGGMGLLNPYNRARRH